MTRKTMYMAAPECINVPTIITKPVEATYDIDGALQTLKMIKLPQNADAQLSMFFTLAFTGRIMPQLGFMVFISWIKVFYYALVGLRQVLAPSSFESFVRGLIGYVLATAILWRSIMLAFNVIFYVGYAFVKTFDFT